MRIYFGQVSEDLLILTLFIIANAMAFIDDKQENSPERRPDYALPTVRCQILLFRGSLYASGLRQNIGFQPQRTIFRMVLCDQFFDVRQYQYATTRYAGQLGNHQTLPAPVGRTITAGVRWWRKWLSVASTASFGTGEE